MSFVEYVKMRKKPIGYLFLCCLIFVGTFWLYHLPMEAVLYPALLSVLAGFLIIFQDYSKVRQKHKMLERIKSLQAELIDELPIPETLIECDYQEIIHNLCDQQKETQILAQKTYQDMIDYYTVWAHQIKTPIAAMQLKLQNEDTDYSRNVHQDLKRIERYVEMVLTYLRLGSESSDFLIREYDLDEIVRPSIRKFAGEFIGKKLSLNYTELNICVITDEKWLSFVIEQLISNAVKYTPAGGVSIYLETPKTLCIADTGIGITQEDLPRVFEKGYTGFNGRMDKKASGIGLYLCKQICDKMGHRITAESEPGKGTIIRIDMDTNLTVE